MNKKKSFKESLTSIAASKGANPLMVEVVPESPYGFENKVEDVVFDDLPSSDEESKKKSAETKPEEEILKEKDEEEDVKEVDDDDDEEEEEDDDDDKEEDDGEKVVKLAKEMLSLAGKKPKEQKE